LEFFRNTNIDFLGKKWYFLTFSLIFSVAGVLSMAFWHGIPLGVDFRGGTLVYVKYAHTPATPLPASRISTTPVR
jgi:preprotein translocase subunit SecF